MPPAASTPAVLLELSGRSYRLPGPLALVQTEGSGDAVRITHINARSLEAIAATCREEADDADVAPAASDRLLTSVSRGGVTVRALTVVAVHAGLLGPAPGGECSPAEERRLLQRAAGRLTWGLAGLVYELMHSQAGHWPSLAPLERQAVAGAALTQLFRLNRSLALSVLRAYGQLSPARFAELLESGLLPAPRLSRAAAAAASAGADDDSDGDAASGAGPAAPPAPEGGCPPPSAAPEEGRPQQEAAAQV